MFRVPFLGPVLWQTLAVPTMADGQLTDFVEPAKWPDWPARYRVQMQYRGFGRALLSTLREDNERNLDSVYARVGHEDWKDVRIDLRAKRLGPIELPADLLQLSLVLAQDIQPGR